VLAEPPAVIAEEAVKHLAVEPAPQKKPSGARPAAPVSTAAPPSVNAPSEPLNQVGDVFITGGAGDVLERGLLLGRAPGRFRLSVGQHSLTLRTASGAEQSMQVEIRAGAPTLVTIATTN
jgi:hypothetical protein